MRHISNEISQRARHLAERDGYRHEIVNDGPVYQVLIIPGLHISVAEENGILTIQGLPTELIMIEGPRGVLIKTSPDERLEWVLGLLQQRMILDDLADV